MRADVELITKVDKAFQQANADVVFIHSNILQGFAVERPEPFSRDALLASHVEAVRYAIGDAELWCPTFNYNFTKTRVFDMATDPSQVGHFSEYVRTHIAAWRTPVPVFSVAGTGPAPALPPEDEIDPFGRHSAFEVLKQRNGLIFNYGCGLESLTFIHHCESQADTLPYRYQKRFCGQIVDPEAGARAATLVFHVRPIGYEMAYDWPRLTTNLMEQGLITRIQESGREFQVIRAKSLAAYWTEKLNEDPLFLLAPQSRSWIEPKLAKLGRGFTLEDFEQAEVTNHG